MYACSSGHLEIIKYLLEEQDMADIDIEEKDHRFLTALAHACACGHLPVVMYLVEERNADTQRDANQRQKLLPMMGAIQYNHILVVKYLLDHLKEGSGLSDDCKKQYMKYACCYGNLAAVKYLLAAETTAKSASFAFQYSCHSGELFILKYVVDDKYAEQFLTHHNICACLACACDNNRLPIVKYLLQWEKFQPTNADNTLFLFCACRNKSISVVKYLLEERNLDVEMKGIDGRTCLMEACGYNASLALVKYLVEEKHANVNAKDEEGSTPLMHACERGALSIVKFLVEERNANLEETDLAGETCLMYACGDGNDNIIKYLVYDCLMDIQRGSSMVEDRFEYGDYFAQKHCSNPLQLKHARRQSIQDMRQFIQRAGLQEKWHSQRNSIFHQLIPLHVTHIYQLVETDNTSALSDLKVCFGERRSSDATPRTVVYARKEKLSKSCTFMENLLTGEMNDVKDDPDDPGMQMVELNQELLGDCPRELLKQLIIFLSWSKDGDCMEHYVTTLATPFEYEEQYPFFSALDALAYCRTVNALGIELDFSAWINMINKGIRAFNTHWLEKARNGHVNWMDQVYGFQIGMHDLWVEVLGVSEDIYFFMLVNSASMSSSFTDSIAPVCYQWLKQYGNNPVYKDALNDNNIIANLMRTTGFDVKTETVSMRFTEVEKFVKRKRQRTE